MRYDPTIYEGSAPHYARGRPPYSRELVATLTSECGLDGHGRLLDVGCGPGILAAELAPRFRSVVGLDPDPGMLAEAARRAAERGATNIRWVQAVAEALPRMRTGRFQLVTFGQSFHWTSRETVAEAIYDRLEPGGHIALIVHTHEGRPKPRGPGLPEVPHGAIRAIIARYLGPARRAGRGLAPPPGERYAAALARTRFGPPRHVFAPGRTDIVRDIDGVVANVLSMSYAAPHLFGDRLHEFERDVRSELAARSPSGRFWDWPGDTEIMLARRAPPPVRRAPSTSSRRSP